MRILKPGRGNGRRACPHTPLHLPKQRVCLHARSICASGRRACTPLVQMELRAYLPAARAQNHPLSHPHLPPVRKAVNIGGNSVLKLPSKITEIIIVRVTVVFFQNGGYYSRGKQLAVVLCS